MKSRGSVSSVRKGASINLANIPTRMTFPRGSRQDREFILNEHVQRLSAQQELLYASDRHALLLIFQGMDAAGKDSAIKHIMSGVNPQGCQVHSFKPPCPDDLQHDFLWRAQRYLPERGQIGIFNRSYYEEVLVVRVHQELLIDEGICDPTSVKHTLWHQRYRSIHNLEQHLHRNGTTIIKFFLHVSRDEQRKRFLARLDDKKKNWKFALSDIEERQHWEQYIKAYEACLPATSTHASPWYIVPADHKDSAHLMVSSIILSTLERLKMAYPEMNEEQNRLMLSIRRKLEQSDI